MLPSCREKARSFRGEETENHAGHFNQKGMGCVDSEACATVGGGWGSKGHSGHIQEIWKCRTSQGAVPLISTALK